MPTAPTARYGREVTTLGGAWAEFRRHRSPWVIAASILVSAAARASLGPPTWRDAVAVVAMLAIFPFGEWAIHVHLLHLPAFRMRGKRIELPTARAHREHHEHPNELGRILLAPVEAIALMWLAVPVAVGAGGVLAALLVPGALPLAPLATGLLAGQTLVGLYEWTHFLIHTAHRPRSRYYRSIHRGHRLHHFKNEHYWHGVTSTLGDRVLGTFPDQADVSRSKTARTLSPR